MSRGMLLADRVRQRYAPKGNVHEPGTYIGGSTITSKAACEIATYYADWIHRNKWDDRSMFGAKPMIEFSFLGNTLGDEAFNVEDGWNWREFSCIEPVATIDDQEWILRCHPDAAAKERVDQYGEVWFGEHKAHSDLTAWHIEKARRQAIVALACAWSTRRRGQSHFDPAPYEDATKNPGFDWDEGWVPGGVVVACASWMAPNHVESVELSSDELDEVLAWYKRKAKIVIECALEDNPEDAAQHWDDKESEMLLSLPYEQRGSIEEVLHERAAAKIAHDQAEATFKATNARLQKALEECGMWDRLLEEKVSVEQWNLRRVQVNGRKTADVKLLENDGLDEYIRQGSPFNYLKVS